MSDFNRVILMGRVGNDPELKTSAQGKAYLRLSLATHTYRAGAEKTTYWHRVMVFGLQAENCAKYLRKGSSVLVEGLLECRTYTDGDGKKASSVSVLANQVQFLGGRLSADVADHEDSEEPVDERLAVSA